jgi:siderophore synthetase component
VQKTFLRWSRSNTDPVGVIEEWFPGRVDEMEKELRELGLDPDGYAPVPVHGWQYRRVIPEMYAEEIRRGIVVPLRRVVVSAKAMSSFRTLQPLSASGAGTVKVAVNSQMTSTVRSISPQTAMNASRFSAMIREALAKEPGLAGIVIPVCERFGIHFAAPWASNDQLRNLTAVFREPVSELTEQEELPIVGTALYAKSPLSGQTVLAELVGLYARTTWEKDLRRAARRFLTEYADLLLTGCLTLMVKYGIGLEGHLQNSIPVFREGRPVRLLIRDWGGARVYAERLVRQGIRYNALPGSLTLVKDINEMRRKVFYTVFQNHLGELIDRLADDFHVSERELWTDVSRMAGSIFEKISRIPEHRRNALADREVFFSERAELKALTLMRLTGNGKEVCHVPVPNPLSRFAGGRGDEWCANSGMLSVDAAESR